VTTHSSLERHRQNRVGWLRAAVLGANDGLISTASLLAGVVAGDAARSTMITTGLAGLCAGALAMAAGEYVSVSAQSDAEQADIEKEREELETQPEAELHELMVIYKNRGLPPALAQQVAEALSAHDALGTHLRDELSITDSTAANPMQAATSSAAAFAMGAVAALLAALAAPASFRLGTIVIVAVIALAALGFVGARLGGAAVAKPVARVIVGGLLAMGVTALIGRLVGTAL
jgi:VIT1/CCC1 family predicted Fe2+/Mn2+ transporter